MAVSANDKIVRGGDLAVIGAQVKAKLAEKQDTLVSGTNIKTINSTTLLGDGDITITNGQDGASAYELWLAAGNIGTEADFLASLKGDSGYSGAAGELEVANRLDSTSATSALSAYQGNVLNKKIEGTTQNYTTGGYLKTDGTVQTNTGYFYTDFVPVSSPSGATLRYNYVTSYGVMYLVTYDENYNRVGSLAANDNSGYRETVLSQDTTIRYVRGSFAIDNKASCSISVNGETIWTAQEDSNGLRDDVQAVADQINDVQADVDGVQTQVDNLHSILYQDVILSEINWTQTAANSQVKKIGKTLIAGVEYKLSIKFEGFSSANMQQLSTISLWLNNSTVVDNTLLGANGFGTRTELSDGQWHTITYTPASNIAYARVIFTSAYSADDPTGVVYFKVAQEDSGIVFKEELDAVSSNVEDSTDLPINVFGDILPTSVKEKIAAYEEDVHIVCVGDSLTGLIEYCDAQEEPEHCPPGDQYKSWVWQLYYNVNKNKAVFDRLDSNRDDTTFFTKNGTWSAVSYSTIDGEQTYEYQYEHSVAANTYRSSDSGAYVQFTFDADSYDKCNIVYSKYPNGAEGEIVIAEGNGKMLASIDRVTWVEANGFAYTENSNPSNAGWNTLRANGTAVCQRHRRIWMKKANGVTGNITIQNKRAAASASGTYLYCWGVERYKGPIVFFDNLGRGGRTTEYLSFNITDIFDRKPDMVIFEMPAANETKNGYATTLSAYTQYFNSSGNNSFKTRSNNYEDMPILVILPHGRSGFFTSDNVAKMYSDQVAGDPVAYLFYKRLYAYVRRILKSYDNAVCINLYDQLLNEANGAGLTYVQAFGNDSSYPKSMTRDSIHPNQRGANKYNKYISPLFEVS